MDCRTHRLSTDAKLRHPGQNHNRLGHSPTVRIGQTGEDSVSGGTVLC
jgi:hypothetical protein